MKFLTESGSIYEIDGDHIRRIPANPGEAKRADALWVRLMKTPRVEVGECAFLVLENLSEYGEDDYGNLVKSEATWRRTSPVERIWDE